MKVSALSSDELQALIERDREIVHELLSGLRRPRAAPLGITFRRCLAWTTEIGKPINEER